MDSQLECEHSTEDARRYFQEADTGYFSSRSPARLTLGSSFPMIVKGVMWVADSSSSASFCSSPS